jgi:hydrogenase-4 component B
MDALLIAIAIQVLSGIAAFACSRSPRAATALGAGGATAGCVLGLVPALRVLLTGAGVSIRLPWDASHGTFSAELDSLSAFFLVPILGLSALAAVYGSAYLFAYRDRKSLGGPWFFFNVFVAGMELVTIARTALLFLAAWEVMSLSAYCLVTFEHEKDESRRAGWIYLIATHLGVAFLILAFVSLARLAGSTEFEAFRNLPAPGAGWSGVLFVLSLVGFGAKAGFVPFHVWLPEAHPAAPSHVSALMSGVMIKMGLYGLLRVLTFLGPPAGWWGQTLAGLGLVTSLVGISLALHQRDLKRVLAYSSIENMGLIGLALGVGLWGSANEMPAVAVLGMTAALLHIWNHTLMKGLMFLAAGSILHATDTRDMEKLGGLMKRMPWTAGLMTAGAVAIAALPPLNGFVSKWLLYLSLMKSGLASSGGGGLSALLSVGLLALVGGLAAITFVRLTGIVLLGSPRSEAAQHAHESSRWMLVPMQILLLMCFLVAVAPQIVTSCLQVPVDEMLGRPVGLSASELLAANAPLSVVGTFNLCLVLAGGAVAVLFFKLAPTARWAEGPTWGCGYARPTRRMQYSARSFAEICAEHLLPRFLRPRTHRHSPRGLFPNESRFSSESPDPVSARVYEPLFRRWADGCSQLRVLQQGKTHVYLIYIVIAVVLALAWVSVRTSWTTS